MSSDREAELQARIGELESELYQLRLISTGASEGVAAGAKAVARQADEDRKAANSTIDELRRQIEGLERYILEHEYVLPTQVSIDELRQKAVETGNPILELGPTCVVWLRAWVMSGSSKVDVLTIYPTLFPGTLEDAGEFVGAMTASLKRMPTLEDVGDWKTTGVSSHELLKIAQKLTPLKYLLPNDYEKARLDAFNHIWANNDSSERQTQRRTALKYFKRRLDDIYENAEIRRDKQSGGGKISYPTMQRLESGLD